VSVVEVEQSVIGWEGAAPHTLQYAVGDNDFTGRPLTDDSSEYVFIAYRNDDTT